MHQKRNFTLIELLVVIAIIGILLTLLLPSLSKARLSAKTTVSMSNLKQINFAATMYTKSNNGFFCLASTNPSTDGKSSWNFRRLIYEDLQGKPFHKKYKKAVKEMAGSTYEDMMFCPILRDERGEIEHNAQGRGDYSLNRYFESYRHIAKIDGGKKEPFMATSLPMGHGHGHPVFRNTEYGKAVSTEYKYTNTKTVVMYLEGNVSLLSLSQGAEINSLVYNKDDFH